MVSCVPCCCPGLPIPWRCAAGCPLPPGLRPQGEGPSAQPRGACQDTRKGSLDVLPLPPPPSPLGTLLRRNQAVDLHPRGLGNTWCSPSQQALSSVPALPCHGQLGCVQALALASPSWASCGSCSLPRGAALGLVLSPSLLRAQWVRCDSWRPHSHVWRVVGVRTAVRGGLLSCTELRRLRAELSAPVCPVCPDGSPLCWQHQPLRVHVSTRASEVVGEAVCDPR